jgi:hypothetical protein
MPQDDQDEKDPIPAPSAAFRQDFATANAAATVLLGRTFRGETSPPVTTPEAIAEIRTMAAVHANKPEAIAIQVYFVAKGIDNPILQASMLAYTKIRTAPVGYFDEIFAAHHEVPAPKTEETKP